MTRQMPPTPPTPPRFGKFLHQVGRKARGLFVLRKAVFAAADARKQFAPCQKRAGRDEHDSRRIDRFSTNILQFNRRPRPSARVCQADIDDGVKQASGRGRTHVLCAHCARNSSRTRTSASVRPTDRRPRSLCPSFFPSFSPFFLFLGPKGRVIHFCFVTFYLPPLLFALPLLPATPSARCFPLLNHSV